MLKVVIILSTRTLSIKSKQDGSNVYLLLASHKYILTFSFSRNRFHLKIVFNFALFNHSCESFKDLSYLFFVILTFFCVPSSSCLTTSYHKACHCYLTKTAAVKLNMNSHLFLFATIFLALQT